MDFIALFNYVLYYKLHEMTDVSFVCVVTTVLLLQVAEATLGFFFFKYFVILIILLIHFIFSACFPTHTPANPMNESIFQIYNTLKTHTKHEELLVSVV